MQCAVLEGPDAMPVMRDRPVLEPGRGEVRVRLRAAALNHRDVWIVKGLYPGLQFPVIPGSDGAGVVEAVGQGAENWQNREVIINPGLNWGSSPGAQGDGFNILGLPRDGTFAESVIVPWDHLERKPKHLSWAEAAALPLAGLTAWRAISSRADLTQDETVLITGIGGGVALAALQFALGLGARVVVTSSSPEKLERAREMGAHRGFNYTKPQWAQRLLDEVGPVEVVVDGAGGPGYEQLMDVTAPGGRIVNYGATAGNPGELPMRKVFWKQLNLLGTTMGSPADFTAMVEFVDRHQIRPVIDRTFRLDQVAEALERMDRGEQFGKIVLEIS